MSDKKARLETLDDIEKEMSRLADHFQGMSGAVVPAGQILRDFADSLSLLAREVRALRNQRG